MTRKDYMDISYKDPTAHDRYYSQFVTPKLINAVVRAIGSEAIIKSTDPHMNDISLHKWDGLHGMVRDHHRPQGCIRCRA